MRFIYENACGRIDLNSGRWKIKEIEGLGLCEKLETKASYPGIDGSELIMSAVESRTITISGDINLKDAGAKEIARAIRVLNTSGTFKIHAGDKKRKIAARCTYFKAEKTDRRASFQPFVLQLEAGYPFFEDEKAEKGSLFYREDVIENSFTLPCVFSRRVSRVNLVNRGDVPCMPKVYIICLAAGSATKVEFKNHTTGKHFALDYKMRKGEEICIDFENRKISSNLSDSKSNYGNLLPFMATDSFLSEFYLDVGSNDVETMSLGEGSEMTAFSEFSAKFIEAVI